MVTAVTTARSSSETNCTTLWSSKTAFLKIQGRQLLGDSGKLKRHLFRCARDEMRMETQLSLTGQAVVLL